MRYCVWASLLWCWRRKSREGGWFVQPSQGGVSGTDDTGRMSLRPILKGASTASYKLCLWPGDDFSFLDSFDCIKIFNCVRELSPLLSKPKQHFFCGYYPNCFSSHTDTTGKTRFTPRKAISMFCFCSKSIESLQSLLWWCPCLLPFFTLLPPPSSGRRRCCPTHNSR